MEVMSVSVCDLVPEPKPLFLKLDIEYFHRKRNFSSDFEPYVTKPVLYKVIKELSMCMVNR
jgi:hypothetical protein